MTKTSPTADPADTRAEDLSDPAASLRPGTQMMTKIDRIDDKGNIREHLTRDGRRTICGLAIGYRQSPCGNATCRRCEKIAARCQIAPRAASGRAEPMNNPIQDKDRP